MQVETGIYTGDGASNRKITLSAGFTPAVVLVHRRGMGNHHLYKNSAMSSDDSFHLRNNTSPILTGIRALESDGFRVGGNFFTNASGGTYYFIALEVDSSVLDTGSYVGNGTSQTIATGFRPEFVLIRSTSSIVAGVVWHGSKGGDNTSAAEASSGLFSTNQVTGDTANGFTLGSNLFVNQSGVTFFYTALKATQGVTTGTYIGDGVDNRNIVMVPTSGAAFKPEAVLLTGAFVGSNPWVASVDALPADESVAGPGSGGSTTDHIQAFNLDGFQVGTNSRVNGLTGEYNFLALSDTGVSFDRIIPLAWRSQILIDRVLPLSWRAGLVINRVIPLAWNGCTVFVGKVLGKITLGQSSAILGGGTRTICPILVNKVLALAWRALVAADRIIPVSWKRELLSVEKIFALAWRAGILFDRILPVAWRLDDPWTDQAASETDAFGKQVSSETDAWVKQVDSEPDTWSS